jgi:ABC-type antimicrobial peptide transport system permease subunit
MVAGLESSARWRIRLRGASGFWPANRAGAIGGGIAALVLREVAALLLAGCLIGGAAALALTGLTRKMLFGVTPADPGVFVLAAVVLGVAALAAGWLPARRASSVDPMVALRHE